MRRMLMTASLMLLAVCYAALPAHATVVLIDNFTNGSTSITIPIDADPSTDIDAVAGVIGGERELMLDRTSVGGLASAFINQIFQPPGEISLENGSGSTSVSMLTYNGVGAVGLDDGMGPAGYDLTGMGMNNSLFIDMISNDVGVTLKFDIMDTMMGTSTLSKTLGILNTTDQYFVFADFMGTADFTKVSKIKLTITSVLNADIVFTLIDSRTNVPEPSSLALLGFGAFSMVAGGFARRRKQQAA
jgi:hypothetical protein